MPELPEVETTTRGLQKRIIGLTIKDVWTDLQTKDKRQLDTVANPKYFSEFRKKVIGQKIILVARRGKNILINLKDGNTILVHMKMTGHLLYGKYQKTAKVKPWKFKKGLALTTKNQVLEQFSWQPTESGPLQDPFNRFIHVVFTFSNKRHLAFSDSRKFGKITLLDIKDITDIYQTKHLKNLGPEPLEESFNLAKLTECLNKKPHGKIKTVLMEQNILVGIGNIYASEILWLAEINPEKRVENLSTQEVTKIFRAIKKILPLGINFGGDSISDYRDVEGRPGKFQLHHQAYGRGGEKCLKRFCGGIILEKVLSTRNSYFCSVHQK
jgi:formamidopyrimidine-DNA glycosylase